FKEPSASPGSPGSWLAPATIPWECAARTATALRKYRHLQVSSLCRVRCALAASSSFLRLIFKSLVTSAAAVAANDRQNFPRDVARAAGCGHKDKRGRDLLGLGCPLHGRVRAKILYLVRGTVGRIERRPDRPRRDGIYPDAAVDQVGGEQSREGMNATLGHGIVDELSAAEEPRDRARHHSGAVGAHVRHDGAGHIEITTQVGFLGCDRSAHR